MLDSRSTIRRTGGTNTGRRSESAATVCRWTAPALALATWARDGTSSTRACRSGDGADNIVELGIVGVAQLDVFENADPIVTLTGEPVLLFVVLIHVATSVVEEPLPEKF